MLSFLTENLIRDLYAINIPLKRIMLKGGDKMVLRERLLAMALLLLIVGAVFGVVFFGMMFGTVGVGYAAILINPLGLTDEEKVSQPIYGPKWFIKAPWVDVKVIYYQTDKYEDTVPCFTADQLEMQVLIQIRWNLNTSKIRDLYLSYPGLNYKAAIESITEQIMKTITKNYTVLETIAYREEVIAKIQDAVLRGLKEAPSLKGALATLEFNLRDIGYPKAYTAAIEAKLVAEQQKLQAQFEREKILILANASAQEQIIKALGEAQSRIIKATSIREAIRLIAEATGITNTTRLVELYLYLEALKEIAPHVNILIITMGKDGLPIFYQIPSNSTG
mgnify:CR=1 FL=1